LSFLKQEGKGKASDEDDDLEEEVASTKATTTFELNDTLYAEAELQDTDTVYLWLGVSVFRYRSKHLLDTSAGQCHVVLQDPSSCHVTKVEVGGG
jgi:hypothetical protein